MIKVPAVMRHAIIAFTVAVGLSVSAFAESFVPGFEDVPLMPGLTVVPESGHVFESPAGRLIEIRATGTVPAAALDKFYRETMPALGWRRTPDGAFVRTNEVLVIEQQSAGGGLTVTFRLSPRSK